MFFIIYIIDIVMDCFRVVVDRTEKHGLHCEGEARPYNTEDPIRETGIRSLLLS